MAGPKFDQVAYFRKISNLSINIKNPAGKNRSADIDAMFNMVTRGKLAAETMAAEERKVFLGKVQQISRVSSTTLGLGGAAVPTNTEDPDIEIPRLATHSGAETVNLAQQNYYDGTERKKDAPKSGISDRREIEFNSTALMAVIISNADENSRRPTNIEFHGDGIEIFRGSGRTLSLTSEQIGGLLIQYCIKMKIAIPREAQKSVRVTSKSVILMFSKELPEILPQAMVWPQAEPLIKPKASNGATGD